MRCILSCIQCAACEKKTKKKKTNKIQISRWIDQSIELEDGVKSVNSAFRTRIDLHTVSFVRSKSVEPIKFKLYMISIAFD